MAASCSLSAADRRCAGRTSAKTRNVLGGNVVDIDRASDPFDRSQFVQPRPRAGPHAADATLHVRDRVRIPCEKVRADRAEAGGRSNRRQREVEIVDLRAYVAEVSDARAAKTAVVKVVRKAS